jgi:integrase
MGLGLLEEFRFDWELAGKAARTIDDYIAALRLLFAECPDPDLGAAKAWMASTSYASVRRKRAQAIRALGRWGEGTGEAVFPWWKEVPLVVEEQRPQPTTTEADYRTARRKVSTNRDRAVIELLWSCGLRRGELVRLDVEDVNLSDGLLVVRQSKTGGPRVVPLSPSARRAARRQISGRTSGSLLGMSSNAIRLLLQRVGVPSAHAWRRGWAVEALRNGVSEASVRSAAGWSSGAMVVRYTRALSGELAVSEFHEAWGKR